MIGDQYTSRNRRVRGECIETPLQHRFVAEPFELLRLPETGTSSDAAGEQNHRDAQGGGYGGRGWG